MVTVESRGQLYRVRVYTPIAGKWAGVVHSVDSDGFDRDVDPPYATAQSVKRCAMNAVHVLTQERRGHAE